MPAKTRVKQNGRMLTEIAMNVRMGYSGAADVYIGIEDDVQLLRDAVHHWRPSILPRYERVDSAVLELIRAVLAEVDASGAFLRLREKVSFVSNTPTGKRPDDLHRTVNERLS